jgi:hypothetical protein
VLPLISYSLTFYFSFFKLEGEGNDTTCYLPFFLNFSTYWLLIFLSSFFLFNIFFHFLLFFPTNEKKKKRVWVEINLMKK